jgi:hypothetical protein
VLKLKIKVHIFTDKEQAIYKRLLYLKDISPFIDIEEYDFNRSGFDKNVKILNCGESLESTLVGNLGINLHTVCTYRKHESLDKPYIPVPLVPIDSRIKLVNDTYNNIQSSPELIVGILNSIDAGVVLRRYMDDNELNLPFLRVHLIDDVDQLQKLSSKLHTYLLTSTSFTNESLALYAMSMNMMVSSIFSNSTLFLDSSVIPQFTQLLNITKSKNRSHLHCYSLQLAQQREAKEHIWNEDVIKQIVLLLNSR